MNAGGRVYLVILGLLLTLSVIVAQGAFRLSRITLSYTYMSTRLEQFAEPLGNPEIHADLAQATFEYLRGELSLEMSQRLEPYIREAITVGFDADWFVRTGKRMLFNTQQLLNGRETELSLPVSIDNFKLVLMDIVRPELNTREYLEIDREVSRMASSIDLITLVPKDDLLRIIGRLKSYRYLLIGVTYGVPGVLLLLCFATGRIGSGLATIGCGLVAGGGLLLLVSFIMPNLAMRAASSSVGRALPSVFDWVEEGAGRFAGEVISGFLPAAAVITGAGLVLAGFGAFLIVANEDPRIFTRRAH